jgi:hypothetical protein
MLGMIIGGMIAAHKERQYLLGMQQQMDIQQQQASRAYVKNENIAIGYEALRDCTPGTKWTNQAPNFESEKPRVRKGLPLDPKNFPSSEVVGFWRKILQIFFD